MAAPFEKRSSHSFFIKNGIYEIKAIFADII